MDKFLQWLLENRNEVGLSVYLLLDIYAHLWAFAKGHIIWGKYHQEQVKSCDQQAETLEEVNEALVEQRILNERTLASLEYAREQISDLRLAVARLEGQQWQAPGGQKP